MRVSGCVCMCVCGLLLPKLGTKTRFTAIVRACESAYLWDDNSHRQRTHACNA